MRPLTWDEGTVATEPSGRFALPVGTVTLLLADIQGSTGIWERAEPSMPEVIGRFDSIVEEIILRHNGVRPIEQGEGDSFVAAFSRPSEAVSCALDLQVLLAKEPWPEGTEPSLRIGVHTGEVQLRNDGNYIGRTINRCARLRELGHGGQTLLSRATHDLVVDRLPAGAALTDMGVVRLRDLARPEQVFQLSHPELRDEFPPLRSLDAVPNNLPLAQTSFIGREREIADVRRLLAETRLLSLTGPGGCGKTRLALQAAAEVLDEYRDGVWFVDLAPLIDPELVAKAVISAVGAVEVPARTATEVLMRELAGKRTLVILDNCEHLLAASATLTDVLLNSCPSLAVIATSREPLGVAAETSYRVPSLSVPPEGEPAPIDGLSQYEAVRLFIERALKARPNFKVTNDNAAAVAQICHRLDGIPLAIELAAVRTRFLTPDRLLEGLEDRFRLLAGGPRTALPRQQTLHASVDWSYQLLGESRKALMRRLAVFAGGFTLDATEDVCAGDEIQRIDVLDLLGGLVDRSLVIMSEEGSEARYHLLETIRQYGLGVLADSGEEEAVRRRHRDHYLRLAEASEPGFLSGSPGSVSRSIGADHDNVRAALEWSSRTNDAISVARIAASLPHFWSNGGHFHEGRRWLDAAISSDISDPALRAKVLWGHAWLSAHLFDYLAVPAVAIEAQELYRSLGNGMGVGRVHALLGWISVQLEGPGAARDRFEQGFSSAQAAGDLWGQAFALGGMGFAEIWRDPPTARTFLQKSISAQTRIGDETWRRVSILDLGIAECFNGELRSSQRTLEDIIEDLRIARELVWLCTGLSFLGMCRTYLGTYEAARSDLDEAREIAQAIGLRMMEANVLFFLGILERVEGNSARARECLERALSFPEAVPFFRASYLQELALTELLDGEHETAEEHVDESIAICRQLDLRWQLSMSLGAKAQICRASGDLGQAEDLCHQGLAWQAEVGEKRQIADSLQLLASLALDQDSLVEAARLFGAAEGLRNAIGYVVPPVDRPAHEAEISLTRERLGSDAFERAFEEGAALSIDDAMAYAVRGRGERKRPSAGWASLTPAELRIVPLIGKGLTNPQIGEQLFISRKTVQAHLASIFAKLGVATRAELAAEATRRGI